MCVRGYAMATEIIVIETLVAKNSCIVVMLVLES